MEQNSEKTEKPETPVVAIDGSRIRTIRETKKLTQLYVSSVVGVTTDTISRWENNRYPSIKRDNAEKLAGALEVELSEILRREEPPAQAEEVVAAPPPPPRKRPVALLAGLALLTIAAAVFLLLRPAVETPAVTRRLPPFSPPGETVPVQLLVAIDADHETGLIVKEQLPPGWRLVKAEPPAVATRGTSEEAKWLLPSGSGRRTISYTVTSPQSAPLSSTATFRGQVVTQSEGQSRSSAIGGDRVMTLTDKHWADRNGDGKIDDNEIMPAYYLTEEMRGLGLEWKTIELIWSSTRYRWDRESHSYLPGR